MSGAAPGGREWVAWSLVAAWSLIIFLTIPVAPALGRWVAAWVGESAFIGVVVGGVTLAAAAVVLRRRRTRRTDRSSAAWLALVAGLVTAYAISLRDSPVEALHFIEYGVLGILLFGALRHRVADWTIYLVGALLGAIVGTLDEAIQWVTPGRYWDLRDLWLNAVGTSLAQVAIAKGVRPELGGRPGPASLRRLCRVALATVALLGASFLNTPPRIAWYSSKVPALQFLAAGDGVMLEYGHLCVDREIGRFRSRLLPAALRREDAARGPTAGRVLDRYADDATYRELLRAHSPASDPFLHEALVHVFRRDRMLRLSESRPARAEEYRNDVTAAFRENQILERYFGSTLRHSRHPWPAEQVEALRPWVHARLEYESAVSLNLVTRVGERTVVGALALVFLTLVAADRRLGRRR